MSHNTANCIVTQGLTGRAWETRKGCTGARKGHAGTRMVGHDTVVWATIQPTTWPRGEGGGGGGGGGGARHSRQRSRRPGWWIVSRYTILYRDRSKGLAAGGCVTIQSLYRDRWVVWLAKVSRYNRLYRDRGRLGRWACRDTML